MNHLYFGDCLDALKELNQQLFGKANNQIFTPPSARKLKEVISGCLIK